MSGEQRSWKVCLRRLQICFGKFEQRTSGRRNLSCLPLWECVSIIRSFFLLSSFFSSFSGIANAEEGKRGGKVFLPLSEEAEEADGKMKEKISSSPPFLSHFFYPFLPLPSSSFVVPVSSLHPSLHPSFLANIKQTQICHASRSPHLPPSLLWEKARGKRRRRRKIPQTQIALSLFPFEIQSIRGSHLNSFSPCQFSSLVFSEAPKNCRRLVRPSHVVNEKEDPERTAREKEEEEEANLSCPYYIRFLRPGPGLIHQAIQPRPSYIPGFFPSLTARVGIYPLAKLRREGVGDFFLGGREGWDDGAQSSSFLSLFRGIFSGGKGRESSG